jgi:hypothetical protein
MLDERNEAYGRMRIGRRNRSWPLWIKSIGSFYLSYFMLMLMLVSSTCVLSKWLRALTCSDSELIQAALSGEPNANSTGLLTIKQEKHQWSATRRRPCPNFSLEWLLRSAAHPVSSHIIPVTLDSSHHEGTKWHFASRIFTAPFYCKTARLEYPERWFADSLG